MPKVKISKTVRDRFKVTGRGKILRRKIGQRHLKSVKSGRNIRRGKRLLRLTGAMERKVRKLLANA